MKAALYLRVSTDSQTTENQEIALRALCEQRGWLIMHVYRDEGISGSKSRDQRPGLDAALKDAARGRYKVLVSWSVDRLGRSLADLLGTLQGLHTAGVDLVLHQSGLDTTSPTGRMTFQLLGVFAEFERAMIQERVKAGLARARKRGKQLGPPRMDIATEGRIRGELLRTTDGLLKIAKRLKVGPQSVARIKADMIEKGILK